MLNHCGECEGMSMAKLIYGKTIDQWKKEYSLLDPLINTEEVIWINNELQSFPGIPTTITMEDVLEAEARFERFAPLLTALFPTLLSSDGIIESPMLPIDKMQTYMREKLNVDITGQLYIKGDHALPVSGSIKARGGFYEVLKFAETIAIKHDLINYNSDYKYLNSAKCKQYFSKYTIAVGSTGNLGLSIGIIGAKLGFNVKVHMSSDAKQWKKQLLREQGVQVIEYEDDYSKAVEMGRHSCSRDPFCYFIDDEHSKDLFLGYAVAALRLQRQLQQLGIKVDKDHPLFVYLPCGVGGAPGGISYGLKLLFGDHVHCFFAEPTHSPCMLLGLMTGKQNQISVQDFGIDNCTAADGLAVGRASGLVGEIVGPYLSGIYTADDSKLFELLYQLYVTEKIKLEPSAVAGMYGPIQLTKSGWFSEKLTKVQLSQGHHIIWSTGGSLVPEEEMELYISKGKAILRGKYGEL